jgi:predicted RNA binding protein YcfA (HicA-like mRNA interferase family)
MFTTKEITERLRRLGWKVNNGEKHIVAEGPSGQIVRIPRIEGNIPVGTLAELEKQTGVKFIR